MFGIFTLKIAFTEKINLRLAQICSMLLVRSEKHKLLYPIILAKLDISLQIFRNTEL